MSWDSILRDVGALATAVGVGIAAYQLRVGRKQARTQFEDSLTREYRKIAARLPVAALLDVGMSEANVLANLDLFFQYIDLCNEQAFLHREDRVSAKTWQEWEDGIATNLGRSGFRQAYTIIASLAPDDFSELRQVVRPELLSAERAASLARQIESLPSPRPRYAPPSSTSDTVGSD